MLNSADANTDFYAHADPDPDAERLTDALPHAGLPLPAEPDLHAPTGA